jgi:hypothetical protein
MLTPNVIEITRAGTTWTHPVTPSEQRVVRPTGTAPRPAVAQPSMNW